MVLNYLNLINQTLKNKFIDFLINTKNLKVISTQNFFNQFNLKIDIDILKELYDITTIFNDEEFTTKTLFLNHTTKNYHIYTHQEVSDLFISSYPIYQQHILMFNNKYLKNNFIKLNHLNDLWMFLNENTQKLYEYKKENKNLYDQLTKICLLFINANLNPNNDYLIDINTYTIINSKLSKQYFNEFYTYLKQNNDPDQWKLTSLLRYLNGVNTKNKGF